jgi:hypothetical protein
MNINTYNNENINNKWIIVSNKKHHSENKNNNNDEQKNYKVLLCKNRGRCLYSSHCLYAHNIKEQNVLPLREKAYNIITNEKDLSYIDLYNNKKLYNVLLCLTRVCENCVIDKCTGGYNCKHGACNKKYVICHNDLNKGNCNIRCNKIHLTKKGLLPYGKSIMNNTKFVKIPKMIVITDNYFNNQKEINICSENDTFTSDDLDDDISYDNLILNNIKVKENKFIKSIFRVNLNSL